MKSGLASMIQNRVHRPAQTVALPDLCVQAGLDCPLQTEWPTRIELLVGPLPPPDGHGRVVHWRNHPDGSYSTHLTDPVAILEMLAYEAHDWQAWEVMRARRRRMPGRFALLT